jgi:glycosyltransferase involved in cell wall biosynthesis
MKISIIIPAYNEEKYIGDCLDSLKNQEILADEIIIVDNNCTDKTVEIAKKYDVKIIKQPIQGIIPARDMGFENTTGDILVRCDADSIAPKDWIKTIKDDFEKENIVGVFGPGEFYDSKIPDFIVLFFFRTYFVLAKIVLNHEILLGSNMAITKIAWEKVKDKTCSEDHIVHEDVDIAIHVGKLGKIKYDERIGNRISARRFRDIASLFEYPARFVKTIIYNQKKGYV